MSAVLIIGDVQKSLDTLCGSFVLRKVSCAEDFKAVYSEFAFLKIGRPLVLYGESAGCVRCRSKVANAAMRGFPEWGLVSSGQRDWSAEAMGY